MSSVVPLTAPTVASGTGKVNARALDAALASIQSTINDLIAAMGKVRQSDDTFADKSVAWRAFTEATKQSVADTINQLVAIRNQITPTVTRPLGDATWSGISPEGGQNVADVTKTYSGAPKATSRVQTITMPGDPNEVYRFRFRIRGLVTATWVTDAYTGGKVYCASPPFTPTGGVTEHPAGGGVAFVGDIGTVPTPAATPVVSPTGSQYGGALVTMTSASPGVEVWYTLDGSDPDPGNGVTTKYVAPTYVGQLVAEGDTITVRATAFGGGYLPSNIGTGSLTGVSTPTPVITPDPGFYYGSQLISVADAEPGVSIQYETTTTPPAAYTAPVRLDSFANQIYSDSAFNFQATASNPFYYGPYASSGFYRLQDVYVDEFAGLQLDTTPFPQCTPAVSIAAYYPAPGQVELDYQVSSSGGQSQFRVHVSIGASTWSCNVYTNNYDNTVKTIYSTGSRPVASAPVFVDGILTGTFTVPFQSSPTGNIANVLGTHACPSYVTVTFGP